MFAHMLGEHACVEIIDIAGGKPDDDSDRFTLVERSLSLEVGNDQEAETRNR